MCVYKPGQLALIKGSMFAGKSTFLIRVVRTHGPQSSLVYKAGIDNRYSGAGAICSHDGASIPAVPVGTNLDLIVEGAKLWIASWKCPPGNLLVVVDEVQFMGPQIVDVAQRLMALGVCTVFAGLDLDFRGDPFGQMPALSQLAHTVVNLKAVCSVCEAPATMTQRLIEGKPAGPSSPLVLVGGAESYEARCPNCHIVPEE